MKTTDIYIIFMAQVIMLTWHNTKQTGKQKRKEMKTYTIKKFKETNQEKNLEKLIFTEA